MMWVEAGTSANHTSLSTVMVSNEAVYA